MWARHQSKKPALEVLYLRLQLSFLLRIRRAAQVFHFGIQRAVDLIQHAAFERLHDLLLVLLRLERHNQLLDQCRFIGIGRFRRRRLPRRKRTQQQQRQNPGQLHTNSQHNVKDITQNRKT